MPPTLAGVTEAVWVTGDLLLPADGEGSLSILDMSAPERPALLGRYETRLQACARDGAVSSDHTYPTMDDGGGSALGLSEPTAPFLAGMYDAQDGVLGVWLAERYLHSGHREPESAYPRGGDRLSSLWLPGSG